MKHLPNKLRTLALATGSLAITLAGAHAAPDTGYNAHDLLLFFQNPTGSAGTDQVVGFSLGSTYDVFRRAATPSDPTFGTVIDLGNINTILTSTFGADWTTLSSSIFAGAAGQNGSINGLSSATSNQDFARTVYVTKPRSGAGAVGTANSGGVTQPSGTSGQGILANDISASNPSVFDTPSNPDATQIAFTIIDENNPFFNGNPSTAYDQILGGVMGAISSTTYTLGSVNNVVLGLDLYRATPVLNASGWQNIEGISGVVAREGYYLGTVTLSDNGDVNFTSVPEPSTALLTLGGVLMASLVARRRRQTSTVQ